MKKYIIFFTTFFLIGFKLFAQINTYTMSTQTVTGICTGAFTDSGVGIGLTSGCYGNNEDFTMTFCSGSTDPLTFIFSIIDIKSGDHLMIYDGPNTSSTLLYDFSDTNPGAITIVSSGTCLTFWFTSDGSGGLFSANGNWAAGFVCGTANPSDVAADECANAPSICDLNAYFGNTSSSYTPDEPGNMCQSCGLFGGSLENNSWMKFIPNNDTVIFTISLLSCSDDIGIQFGVYSGTNCDNFVLMTDPSWTSSSAPITPGSVSTIVATGLVPGQVYYIMIDGNAGDDCQYIINAQSGIQFGATITPDQSICPGNTATVGLSASGSVPIIWSASPTDPSLVGQEHNQSITVTPSVTTVYSAYVQDSAGFCSVDSTLTTTVTVLSPYDTACVTGIICSINKTDATTCPVPPSNTCNGMATVIVTGGTGSFTYIWNDGNTSSSRNNLCAGTYTVSVTDVNVPTSVTSCSVTGLGPVPPTLSFTTTSSCQPGSNGAINLSILTGLPPYTYVWSNNATSEDLNGISAGNYSVTVSDITLCTSDTTITVNAIPAPQVSFTYSGSGCTPVTAHFLDTTNDSIVDWHWELGDGTVVDDVNQFTHVFTATTQVENYWAKLWVENNLGCSSELLINNAITVYPIPIASILANPMIVFHNENILFTGGTGYGINEWDWNFNYPDGTFQTYNTNTVNSSYADEGTYTVYLIVSNAGGCSDSASIQVEVIDIEIPNIFTPNGDGSNDYFKIKNIEKLQNTRVMIYNRWGKKIFDAENYKNDWNGENHADGTYYYIITLGGDSSFHGIISILR